MSEKSDTNIAEMRGKEWDHPGLDRDGMNAARQLANGWADRLESAIKAEREEHVFIAINNFEEGKRKGYAMAKSEFVPPHPPKTNHERFSNYDDALRTYKYEMKEVVYDFDTMEKFCKWLYSKKCDDSCPYYRIVEGEGECRPRCTNICGNCFDAREEAN